VSLLFCGICLKHYAYHNMSRRTQLSTKFFFQVTAQLSENFIFIYLGLSLFTDDKLDYKPLFILVTVAGICAARWCAVFPLARLINAISRYRQRRRGEDIVEEIPYTHQAMIFWAGLRGAVGVALAAGLTGSNGDPLRATVLIVVVITVIVFGGTTARMLEILGIRTGVVEEIDSDDEFDIEVVNGGTYARNKGLGGIGHTPRPSQNGFTLSTVNNNHTSAESGSGYSSGSNSNSLSHTSTPRAATRRASAPTALTSPSYPRASATPRTWTSRLMRGARRVPGSVWSRGIRRVGIARTRGRRRWAPSSSCLARLVAIRRMRLGLLMMGF
jgi:sodium/hydrogen exchanger-like protein 6/7